MNTDIIVAFACAAVSTAALFALKATSAMLLWPAKTAFSTPRTASLAKAELRKPTNVRQPMPKILVTGSNAVPTLYSREFSTFSVDV